MPNRTIAPDIAPLIAPELLPYHRFFIDNGIEVVYIHDPAQEVFKTDITFEAGIYYQPQPLIASTAISMLSEGTTHHSAEEIADLFDYYGAYIDLSCGLNRSEFNLFSLNKYAEPTIAMMAEMAAESIFPEKELDILLTNKRQEFLVNKEKTAWLARMEFSSRLFGATHPYANSIDNSDFEKVSPRMIREFYQQHFTTRHCRINICGNVNEDILKLISKHFQGLSQADMSQPALSRPFSPSAPGLYHIQKENAVQTSIRIGKTGLRLTDSDYAGFMLLNTILGGYFGSRLMSNIREEKGYTYGINSFNVSMPLGSYWCIATDVNARHTQAAIEEILKEIRRLQTEKVSEEELGLVRNFLHGDLLREVDGVFAQSDALKHKLNYGLDNRIYTEMIRQINQTTPEDLLALANKYWDTGEMYIVTAGEK